MRAKLVLITISLFLLTAITACRHSSAKHAFPEDPLFVSKSPIEAKTPLVVRPHVSHYEPAPPNVPPRVLAAAARQNDVQMAGRKKSAVTQVARGSSER